MDPEAPIVLVGMMGSGKSTVGPLLAERLVRSFFDADGIIEARTGVSITELFSREGEEGFRDRERAVVAELLSRPSAVVAPGGGWAARAEAWEGLPPGTRTVWLRVRPETVQRRVHEAEERSRRPLLAGPDPESRITELSKARAPFYARADLTVDTDERSPAQVADRIESLLKELL